jgi:pimeloyl-ACP methyl ester carboxylesterase
MNTTSLPLSTTRAVQFKTVQLDQLTIFYREAGSVDAPVLLLLHGFPSSSHMYRNLISELAPKYHIIAPDYPGFGLSSCPSPQTFGYTFDHLAAVMEKFIDALGLTTFSLYMQDYGGPVGFRIAAKRPELIETLLIQNANAYVEGLGPVVRKIGELQQAGNVKSLQTQVSHMLSLEGIKENYIYSSESVTRIAPDAYLLDHFFMERSGSKDIQATLFGNYSTNFLQYDSWHHYLRTHQPATLILWGKYDPIFTVPGAEAYLQDLPQAELHILEGGHFLLEEQYETVARLIDQFLAHALSR